MGANASAEFRRDQLSGSSTYGTAGEYVSSNNKYEIHRSCVAATSENVKKEIQNIITGSEKSKGQAEFECPSEIIPFNINIQNRRMGDPCWETRERLAAQKLLAYHLRVLEKELKTKEEEGKQKKEEEKSFSEEKLHYLKCELRDDLNLDNTYYYFDRNGRLIKRRYPAVQVGVIKYAKRLIPEVEKIEEIKSSRVRPRYAPDEFEQMNKDSYRNMNPLTDDDALPTVLDSQGRSTRKPSVNYSNLYGYNNNNNNNMTSTYSKASSRVQSTIRTTTNELSSEESSLSSMTSTTSSTQSAQEVKTSESSSSSAMSSSSSATISSESSKANSSPPAPEPASLPAPPPAQPVQAAVPTPAEPTPPPEPVPPKPPIANNPMANMFAQLRAKVPLKESTVKVLPGGQVKTEDKKPTFAQSVEKKLSFNITEKNENTNLSSKPSLKLSEMPKPDPSRMLLMQAITARKAPAAAAAGKKNEPPPKPPAKKAEAAWKKRVSVDLENQLSKGMVDTLNLRGLRKALVENRTGLTLRKPIVEESEAATSQETPSSSSESSSFSSSSEEDVVPPMPVVPKPPPPRVVKINSQKSDIGFKTLNKKGTINVAEELLDISPTDRRGSGFMCTTYPTEEMKAAKRDFGSIVDQLKQTRSLMSNH